MSRIADGISVRIRESVDSSTITKILDHKAFERIRNYGQALVHEDAGVVIESYDHRNKHYHQNSNCLKNYHQPGYIYSLKTRKTAFTATYTVAYAVSKAFPLEPFKNLDNELIYSKPYRVSCKEPQVIQKVFPASMGHRSVNLEPDGILLNDTHGGLLSFASDFDPKSIQEFHDTCMGFYHFQKLTNDKGKIYDLWKTLFSKKVMLYFGFRCSLTEEKINFCRSLNIRPLSWEEDRMQLQ